MQFYGYKKCSTCRTAHRFLSDHGVELPFRDFVENPPSVDQLQTWVKIRGEGVMPFVNSKGTVYRELGLADKKLTDTQWIELLSTNGKLIKRPLLALADHILLGFDPAEYERALNA